MLIAHDECGIRMASLEELFEGRRTRFDRNLQTLERTLVRTPEGDRVAAAQLLRRPEVRLPELIKDGLSIELDAERSAVDLASNGLEADKMAKTNAWISLRFR